MVRTLLVAKLAKPVGMAVRASDPSLYVASKTGEVWAIRNGRVDPAPVLDLSKDVSKGDEQGLLGLAFSPRGEFLYVNYTDRKGDTNVVEYAWRNGRPDVSSRRVVLFVRQPFPNHNGGDLLFGPDGYLYVGLGDGGSDYRSGDPQGDPHRNGQNRGVLLGKMLRIEPRMPDGSLPPAGAAYAVPPDNPFVGRVGVRREIWAYGLRNPWRYSFDALTGDLWIGDVGAGASEEIDEQPAGSGGGQNYGWNALEGTVVHRHPPSGAIPPCTSTTMAPTDARSPVGTCIEGRRCRAWTAGTCSGTTVGAITALRLVSGRSRVYVISDADIQGLSSFGQDQQGELYALSLAGGVYKLAP